MEKVSLELTIFFEDGFYYGLFESRRARDVRVCKMIFGAEPKIPELLDFINNHFSSLQFSPALPDKKKHQKPNPKRLQRLARKEMVRPALSTKAQEALRIQREEQKVFEHRRTKAERRAERERRFALKQEKRKAKHRGR